jgi:hypothetical protein
MGFASSIEVCPGQTVILGGRGGEARSETEANTSMEGLCGWTAGGQAAMPEGHLEVTRHA